MAKTASIKPNQVEDLLYQALETEMGGVQVYQAAIGCAINDDLKEEWQGYLEETTTHRQVLLTVFEQLGLDPDADVPSRAVVAHHGKSLDKAIELAETQGDPAGAPRVAADCVGLADTRADGRRGGGA